MIWDRYIDKRDEAELVPADIEHRQVSHEISGGKHGFQSRRICAGMRLIVLCHAVSGATALRCLVQNSRSARLLMNSHFPMFP
jgi:hypothetical protein